MLKKGTRQDQHRHHQRASQNRPPRPDIAATVGAEGNGQRKSVANLARRPPRSLRLARTAVATSGRPAESSLSVAGPIRSSTSEVCDARRNEAVDQRQCPATRRMTQLAVFISRPCELPLSCPSELPRFLNPQGVACARTGSAADPNCAVWNLLPLCRVANAAPNALRRHSGPCLLDAVVSRALTDAEAETSAGYGRYARAGAGQVVREQLADRDRAEPRNERNGYGHGLDLSQVLGRI